MKTPRHHKLAYLSSYDRGLEYLLIMWKDIKQAIPDAELNIAYGWDMFDKIAANNPERKKWQKTMMTLMTQEGIIHHGRLGKKHLQNLRKECGILAYPTNFFEINCITVLECQRDGCVPVVMNQKEWNEGETYTALNETVYAGIKVEGNIRKDEDRQTYLRKLIKLMNDGAEWERLSKYGMKHAYKYSWDNISEGWSKEFAAPLSEPLVSVITPTIRKGFWNLMAANLSQQTYKNIEWVVVDDYPKDRSYYMKKACDKWHINGKYVRGGRTDKFYYGLSTANNIGWQNSSGELLVWLQDFVLIPHHGIEHYVDIYRHHPNVMIAGTDVYHFPRIKPSVDQEDWFNGEVEVIGEFSWENVRNQDRGIRFSDNPAELEMNYCAIPRSVIESVGGWYEFFNDGLGFDNTEFAYRALNTGSKLIVDDTNKAVCLDHWEALKDNPEQLGEKRTHRLNDPRYFWLLKQLKTGKLPYKRDPKQDTFRLEYLIPEDLSQSGAVDWMNDHMQEIINKWENII